MTPSTPQRLTLIAALYVSQAIPLGFFIVALPAILRDRGVGLEKVGLLGALAFPWLLKFLWAPFVDRFGARRLGHYRSWIVPMQCLSATAVLVIAWTGLDDGLGVLLVAGAVFMFASATQDIATDGLAVRTFTAAERGRANGVQVGGYYLGQILGGGLILVLYGRHGWTPAVLVMAALLALPLLPAMRFREARPAVDAGPSRVDFRAMGRFFRRPGARTWVAVLLLYRSGEAMALTMVNPMLVDGGLSLEAIGLLLGLVSSLAALAGALAGGWLTGVLGRLRSLIVFGGLQSLALCAFTVPAAGFLTPAVLYVVAAAAAFAGGMGTAALYTNMMDRTDPRTAATDFTLQQSICAVGPLLGSALSGFSAARLGYSLHFTLCATVTLAAVLVVARRLTARHAAPPLAAPLPGLETG